MLASKKAIGFLFFFFLFFLFSIQSLQTIAPVELVVEGKLTQGNHGELVVEFDSGNGFNAYESEQFKVEHHPGKSELRMIRVGYSGQKNPLTYGKDITCQKIFFDGVAFSFEKFEIDKAHIENGQGVRIYPGGFVKVPNTAQYSARIDLRTDYLTGNADVSVNGDVFIEDLYTTNYAIKTRSLKYWYVDAENQFKVNVTLPRYPIRKLKVISKTTGLKITSVSEGRGIEMLAQRKFYQHNVGEDHVALAGDQFQQKVYIEKHRLLYQFCFAGISTWFFLGLIGWSYRVGRNGERLAGLCRRNIFPITVFLTATAVFSLWLMAFWPGLASIDSLNIWRAAKLSEPSQAVGHPAINVILYMYLMQIWDNLAIVPITQIICLSLLIAAVFGYVHRQGVSVLWLLPLVGLVLSSVSIGLYNTALWKDIPFALLVVSWGLIFVVLHHRKLKGNLALSTKEWLVLLGLYVSVGLVRHNGVVFFLAIPGILLLLNILPRKIFLLFILASCLCCVLLWLIPIGDKSYLVQRLTAYLQNFTTVFTVQTVIEFPMKYLHSLDIGANSDGSDLWHYHLGDRYAYDFLKDVGWNDIYPYLGERKAGIVPFTDVCNMLYEKSYVFPWVYSSWNTVWGVVIIPTVLVLYRKFPNTALFSSLLFIQALALILVVDSVNWRYFYFLCLGSYFLLPLMMLDIKRLCR